MTNTIYIHQPEKAVSFTRLPNFLFEAPSFTPLSNEAKVLYAFILRRTDLSRKNGWADEYGRKNERRQMELVQALSIDFNLVCYFNLDTGTGNTLRVNECHNDMLKPIFAQVGDFDLEEKMDRYIENCVYEEDRKLLRECCSI